MTPAQFDVDGFRSGGSLGRREWYSGRELHSPIGPVSWHVNFYGGALGDLSLTGPHTNYNWPFSEIAFHARIGAAFTASLGSPHKSVPQFPTPRSRRSAAWWSGLKDVEWLSQIVNPTWEYEWGGVHTVIEPRDLDCHAVIYWNIPERRPLLSRIALALASKIRI